MLPLVARMIYADVALEESSGDSPSALLLRAVLDAENDGALRNASSQSRVAAKMQAVVLTSTAYVEPSAGPWRTLASSASWALPERRDVGEAWN